MALTGAVYAFGIRDIKIVPASGSAVDLPAARTLKYTEEPVSNELEGDDVIVAKVTFTKSIAFELEAGGISLEAHAALTGRTLVNAGTTPSQTSTMKAVGGESWPYVKIYGKMIGDVGDVHVKFPKAKLESLEGEFKNGEFMVTKASGVAIDNGTSILDVVWNETATALPSS
jgi:hypothetical protein